MFGTRTKVYHFPTSVVSLVSSVLLLLLIVMREDSVVCFTAGEALTAIAATVVTGPKRVLGVIIRLR